MEDHTSRALFSLSVNAAILLIFGAATLGYACLVSSILSLILAAVVDGRSGR
jgi:hypothetical protein